MKTKTLSTVSFKKVCRKMMPYLASLIVLGISACQQTNNQTNNKISTLQDFMKGTVTHLRLNEEEFKLFVANAETVDSDSIDMPRTSFFEVTQLPWKSSYMVQMRCYPRACELCTPLVKGNKNNLGEVELISNCFCIPRRDCPLPPPLPEIKDVCKFKISKGKLSCYGYCNSKAERCKLKIRKIAPIVDFDRGINKGPLARYILYCACSL